MANFKTHFTVGSAVSFSYTLLIFLLGWITSGLVALAVYIATLIGSFLPDMDSDNSLPLKIMFNIYAYLSAGFTIIFMTENNMQIIYALLTALIVFFFVRYGISQILKTYTHHRGIFHSIPAVLIAFFATLLILWNGNLNALDKLSIALGVAIGYFTHLLLDEIYSVQFLTDENTTKLKVKKSFGTALDFGFSSAQPKYTGIIAWIIVILLFLLCLPLLKQIYFAFLQ